MKTTFKWSSKRGNGSYFDPKLNHFIKAPMQGFNDELQLAKEASYPSKRNLIILALQRIIQRTRVIESNRSILLPNRMGVYIGEERELSYDNYHNEMFIGTCRTEDGCYVEFKPFHYKWFGRTIQWLIKNFELT